MGVISGLYRDNGKENGSYYLGVSGFGEFLRDVGTHLLVGSSRE